ncbi:MAG: tetratricopeptide repeat protein [Acidobacteria bacterium]|nr:tetratricopeptide repeat protein [Acidobacteriota bacterium]
MRFPVLLTLLLGIASADTALAQAADPTFGEAVQMVSDGREADALVAFRRVVAANPNNLEARLWIARLHERMGHPDQAESVYRSVLLENPTSLDAALGVAATMLERDDVDGTIEVLATVEERAPQNAEALTLLGRAHRLAGHDARAIGYFERAVAVAPTAEHRARLEDARRSYLHRIEVRGFGEQYSGPTADTTGGDVIVNYRLSDRLRVIGRGQAQRKFSVSEQRGGGGLEWRWRPATTLRAHLLVGPGNLVAPEGDFLGEIDHAYAGAVWTGSIRYFDFTGARTTFLSPGVSWPASDRLSLGLRYALSWTETSTRTHVAIGHTAQVRGAYRLLRRVSLEGGYAAGVEDFETFSIDRIGDFRANTVSGGVRLELPTLTAIVGGYERQWRRGSIDMGRATVAIQQRF